MIITVEKWADFYPECLPLMREHNAEVGESEERMPFDIDADTCAALETIGALLIVTARKDGKLIGYCGFTLGNSLLSKNVLCGTQGPFFVTKDERSSGAGLSLYRHAFREMKQLGVKNVYPHHYLRGDSARLGEFFEHLGAKPLQHEYSLWIGD